VRHDEHVSGVPLVLPDVALQILDDERDVLSLGGSAALHRDADHALVRCPLADVVVEHVGFNGLLLDLVAPASRHEDEHRAIGTALVGHEDVDEILWLRAIGDVAHDRNAGIQLHLRVGHYCVDWPVCVVVVLAK
jgi:hypothetical protein